jgi:hypothetical protein
MGYLDSSTNNIIVDAVLTNTGRAALARNDGSFSIVKFAYGDDDVDYGLIQKFGRVVGKEKIEKNTPVFEGLTNQNFAQKFRCITVSNPNLIRLPILELTGEGLVSSVVSMGAQTTKTRELTASQAIQNEDTIDVELRDQAFLVKLNNKFLQIANTSPDDVDDSRIATYLITRDPGETAVGGSKVTFTLQVKSISDAEFDTFGVTSNKNLIRTFVSVSGVQSGAVKEFEIQINKSQ